MGMFDGIPSRSDPVGNGYSQLRQVFEGIARDMTSRADSPIKMATVIRDGVIVLDSDGYEIYANSGNVVSLAGQHYLAGDRIYAISVSREQVLVLGRANPIQSPYPSYVTTTILDDVGLSTTEDSMGDPSASVTQVFVLSGATLQPSAPIRVRGRVTRLSGTGACAVTLNDEANGQLFSQNLGEGGDFDFGVSWLDIGTDDLNIMTLTLTYDDAQNGSARLHRAAVLIGAP